MAGMVRTYSSAGAETGRLRRVILLAAALLVAAGMVLGSAMTVPASAAQADMMPFAKGGGGSGKPPKGGGGGGSGGGGGGSTERPYAAVGDSFAAGVGAGSYSGGSCNRSANSYPKLLDTEATLQLVAFPACSGADTAATMTQLTTGVSGSPTIVTITVGGNDVGFADVMRTCFILISNSSCEANIARGHDIAASGEFAGDLGAVIDEAKAGGRTVVVTGYPLLFWENSSGVNPKYAWGDEVNEETLFLNSMIAGIAGSHGAIYVDVVDAFDGHGISSRSPWINDFKLWNTTDAFHPNSSGYAAYRTEVLAAIPAA